MTFDPSSTNNHRGWSRVVIAGAGDAVVLLLFAAIGRASHQESGAEMPLRVLSTALPFLIAWFVAAPRLHVYAPEALRSWRTGVRRTAIAWIVGGFLGLIIRSFLEGRIVPLSFAGIALLFNLVLLVGWHACLPRLAHARA